MVRYEDFFSRGVVTGVERTGDAFGEKLELTIEMLVVPISLDAFDQFFFFVAVRCKR